MKFIAAAVGGLPLLLPLLALSLVLLLRPSPSLSFYLARLNVEMKNFCLLSLSLCALWVNCCRPGNDLLSLSLGVFSSLFFERVARPWAL